MAAKLLVAFMFGFLLYFVSAVPERGVKEMRLKNKQAGKFSKSLFKGATISITGNIQYDERSKKKNKPRFKVKWSLYEYNCVGVGKWSCEKFERHVNTSTDPVHITCVEKDSKEVNGEPFHFSKTTPTHPSPTKKNSNGPHTTKGDKHQRKKRAPAQEANNLSNPVQTQDYATKISHDGNYMLCIKVERSDSQQQQQENEKDCVQVKVKMQSDTGYLSASEWPLLPFYGRMSLVYLAYGVVWLIISAYQWRELLRIQFWIGGVIALGMLEKAVLFSEYDHVNNTGIPDHGLLVFAQILSCIMRSLSRILVIIVSMGFGIVKPHLGSALHRVLGVGSLYFILCIIGGSYQESSEKANVDTKRIMYAGIPLSVLDTAICWWIFMSLMQTMRTLRIHKNVVKLSLYRHFTIILAFSVVASIAFMIWAIKYHHLNECIEDWKELWIDDAFWHFLFAIILLAIMVLWRPTANNQRYAFTPLMDVVDDDNDDMTLSDAFQGMKMRNKSEGETTSHAEKNRSKAEDDLKWVEENIPSAGGIDTK